MKKSIALIITLLFGVSLTAQQSFQVPQLGPEQKIEVLYSHALGYNLTGINYAKSKGDTPEKYGEYVGSLFKPFWNPAEGFPAFANGMLYIMAGLHPDNQMQIVNQSENSLHFKLKNVDYSFKMGPAYGITYQEFLECAEGIISVLADHMNVEFSHKMNEGWYEVKLSAR